MTEVKAVRLIGGVHGPSRNLDPADPEAIAKEWIDRDDPSTTVRFVLDDGTTSHGTYQQVKPILDAIDRLRAG